MCRPSSAGHAESDGEEEAGIHPRADRHGGELRQRPAARHGGKHAGSLKESHSSDAFTVMRNENEKTPTHHQQ